MHVTANLILESAGAAPFGAGAAIPLQGAPTGYRPFSAAGEAGSTLHYMVRGVDVVGRPTGQWEIGRGTLAKTGEAWSILRTVVFESSAGLAKAESFVSGDKLVQLSQLAPSSEQARADILDSLGLDNLGQVAEFAGLAVPAGWLATGPAATGNRVTHARLFARIGTTFGAGDGSKTFGLPPTVSSKSGHVACIKF